MFRLREIVENLTPRVVNEEIEVRDNAVFIRDDIKFEYGNWYIKVDNIWNNLQGGVPNYTSETNLDADIFEPEEVETEQDV